VSGKASPRTGAIQPGTSSRGGQANRGEADHASRPEPGVLLATKLHVPELRQKLISRTGLVDALSAGHDHKLTLLDAPAGWGKTTLLAEWIACDQERHRFAWVSLDPADNDPVRFWTYVVAALQKANPGIAARSLELLGMGADPRQVVLPALLNELAGLPGQIVLLLDDYHLVTNRDIHEELAFVIGRMPPSLRLVIASRSDPPLPLARLRVGGDLVEVRTHELRFAAGEAALLLNDAFGLDLAEEDITLLCRRTEGWAAGLYLAALSLQRSPDADTFIRSFAGDNRHVVDYLSAEVLDSQPPDLRAFLLRTSVLERLSGPLCDAVLQTSASAAILEQIERQNLFLVPLDSSRRWYRYHHLFRELLRSELHRTEPGLILALHHRAAAWFAALGSTDEAVHHLAAAADVAGAAELIAASWGPEFDRGRLFTVSGWLDLLPEQTVTGDPRLCVARAWIALDLRRLNDAGRWIEAAEARLAGGTIGAEIAVLRALQRFKIGDITAAADAARNAIRLDLGDSHPGRSAAYCLYGATLYWSGSPHEAWSAFSRAVQLADEAGNYAGRTYAAGYLALISAERRQLAEAERQIRRASGNDGDAAVGEHFAAMMVSLAAAKVGDQRGEIAAADEAALRAVVLSQRGGGYLEMAAALMTRADILEHLGDRDTARASVEEARAVLRHCRDPGLAWQLLAAAEHLAGRGVSRHRATAAFGEEVTSKELEVLGLLATPLSRREIGAQLYVSVNTVKTHQRALYRKLEAADRATAVDRARELRLL
jgi:LuxR family transcriptional regulator, maltose regulon positive regulatory protein